MNASITTSAIVIHRSDWRDYDRMVTLFTPEYGRIDAVARGCRRPKSPLMNASDMFTAGEYQLLKVRDRYTITQCRIQNSFFELREDYDRLVTGVYWLKLINEVIVSDEPNRALFDMTLRALAYLAHSGMDQALLTAMFKMQLWRITGFSPNMDSCILCHTPAEKTTLLFDAHRGGCVCRICGTVCSNSERRHCSTVGEESEAGYGYDRTL